MRNHKIAKQLINLAHFIICGKPLNAGFSNYKNLLQRVLNTLESKIEKIYPDGKFTLTLEPEVPLKDNIQIKVILTSNPEDESEVKQLKNSYQIKIETYSNDKIDIYRSLAHEITHISQKMNGFTDFSYDSIFKKLRENKNYTDSTKERKNLIRENMHGEKTTEHEAKLVGVLQLLKMNQIEKALNEVLSEPEYYKFDNHDFIKKGYAYGITNKEIFQEFKNKIHDKIQGMFNKDFRTEEILSSLENVLPVLKMVGIDSSIFFDELKERYLKQTKKYDNYNYSYIEKKLGITH